MSGWTSKFVGLCFLFLDLFMCQRESFLGVHLMILGANFVSLENDLNT